MVATLCMAGGCGMAIEEASYKILRKEKEFEIRVYAPQILATTVVDGSREEAGNKAFGRLFGYISGKNKSRQKIAMTAPVAQEAASEKIKMTAPVGQQRVDGGWEIAFMMPASYTMETLPIPDNSAVRLRRVAGRVVAVVRYSGVWTEARYLHHLTLLEDWMTDQHLRPMGTPVWARYNPPFTPWFLRRNEILIPIQDVRVEVDR
jgi:hypothetical protein